MIRLFFVSVLFLPALVSADMVITEIMYDLAEGSDSGREWIEVFNAGTAPVILTDWKVFENGTNHKVTAVVGGDSVAAGNFAVIADNAEKFKADWPSYSGLLFDSAFSLSNEGETVVLRTGENDVDSATFSSGMGGNGTGDSLQREPGAVFAAGIPTPGVPIPTGGLIKNPQKQSAKKPVKNATLSVAPTIVGDEVSPHVATAVTAAPQKTGAYWWLAPLLLACAGSGGIVAARHFRKNEWDIIEEIEESS